MNAKNWMFVLIACAKMFPVSFDSEARGALTAYEPFNYANVGGDLNGQSGGGSFGFTDAWAGNTSFNIGSGSLVSPVSPFPTSGNSMTTVAYGGNRDIFRTLSTPLGTEGTTRYASFLMRPEGILHQGAYDGWFNVLLGGTQSVYVGMGSYVSTYGLEVSGTSVQTSKNVVVGETVLMVLRFDFTEGVDPVRLYINPQPGAPEPAVANASQINLDVNQISFIDLTGPGAYSVDEIRIGTTYADVTSVPEPSALAALATALAVFLSAARRLSRCNR